MNKMIFGISAALVVLGTPAAMAADGKAVYAQTCSVCHAGGVAGAPKTGDKGTWGTRLNGGRDALLAAVIKGKGTMPAKGGNSSLTEADVKAALDFMLDQSK